MPHKTSARISGNCRFDGVKLRQRKQILRKKLRKYCVNEFEDVCDKFGWQVTETTWARVVCSTNEDLDRKSERTFTRETCAVATSRHLIPGFFLEEDQTYILQSKDVLGYLFNFCSQVLKSIYRLKEIGCFLPSNDCCDINLAFKQHVSFTCTCRFLKKKYEYILNWLHSFTLAL